MRLPPGRKIAHGMTGGRRPCERRECIKQRDDVTSGVLLRLSVDNRSLISRMVTYGTPVFYLTPFFVNIPTVRFRDETCRRVLFFSESRYSLPDTAHDISGTSKHVATTFGIHFQR